MACGSGCSTGCAKLAVTYDWLDNMLPPNVAEGDNIYEIRFKSTRKGFYRNANGLPVVTGDSVVVESERGYDIGLISMGGELVRLQMKKKKIDDRYISNILRIANEYDLKRLEELRQLEQEYLVQTRAIIRTLDLDMKLSDIEFQGDGSKAIFYYTAEHRVDFRELIRTLASEFKLRIEMRQIGLRQESGLLGGLGSCGRELCCSTWLTDFKSVNTSAARYQNISLNPSKITGMCGRLKCCLNYELETYLDALKDFPDVKEIKTELGIAFLQKTDIFKRKLWYSYGGDANWVSLEVEQVIQLHQMNRKGIVPPNLVAFEEDQKNLKPRSKMNLSQGRIARENSDSAPVDYVDVVGQSNLHERRGRNPSNNNNPRDRKRKSVSGNTPVTHRSGGHGHSRGTTPNRPPSAEGEKRTKPNTPKTGGQMTVRKNTPNQGQNPNPNPPVQRVERTVTPRPENKERKGPPPNENAPVSVENQSPKPKNSNQQEQRHPRNNKNRNRNTRPENRNDKPVENNAADTSGKE